MKHVFQAILATKETMHFAWGKVMPRHPLIVDYDDGDDIIEVEVLVRSGRKFKINRRDLEYFTHIPERKG